MVVRSGVVKTRHFPAHIISPLEHVTHLLSIEMPNTDYAEGNQTSVDRFPRLDCSHAARRSTRNTARFRSLLHL